MDWFLDEFQAGPVWSHDLAKTGPNRTHWNRLGFMKSIALSDAAKLVGKSRSTLYRWAKSGKLSTTIAPQGERLVDPAELERVFGPLRVICESQNRDSVNEGRTHVETALLRDQIGLLRDQLRTCQEEKAQLLTILDRQTLLLTDQRVERGEWSGGEEAPREEKEKPGKRKDGGKRRKGKKGKKGKRRGK